LQKPTPPHTPPDPAVRNRAASAAALILIYFGVVWLLPRPEAIQPEAWRLLGIFAATIAGLILRPISGGALVLAAITLAIMLGGLTPVEALAGFGDPSVWLVMAAFFISDALIKTGLARRIALVFVRAVGRSSLGVCYALSSTDMVLASIIPSNAARSGGVVLPIARSIAELYDSRPGPTAALLGTFLVTGVYQSVCVTAAMFITGQASNPLVARIAGEAFGYAVTPLSWIVAAIVPGLCSLAVVPLVVSRLAPPGIRRTPEAAEFAAAELRKMGPITFPERLALAIFLGVCGMWITAPWHGIDITTTALTGAVALLFTGILKWEDATGNRAAWDIFIWYGGLLRLGKALGDTGITREFASAVGGMLEGFGWPILLGIALLVYFYAHYGFASITAHILAMFLPFGAVLLAQDAPVGLVFFSFACFTNFSAGLTHYGTTPAPMYFATGYASFAQWWKIGFVVSVVNLAIWFTIGFGWWKLIGIW
jgi:divalent anion:Na+ symporter, DASS family